MRKLLVVDDDWQMLMAPLYQYFESEFEFFFAKDEAIAKEILEKEAIDIILMDGNLCSDRDGVDVVRTLRANGIMAKIIMFSSDEKLNAAGISVGADSSWNKNRLYKEDRIASLLMIVG